MIRIPRPLRSSGAQAGAPRPTTGSARLGWLDALRGVAALSVAIYHLALPFFWIPRGTRIPHYLDPGIFGVMLFFLVSGYIVPVSLERRGNVQAFWTGRLFRLYPVLLVPVLLSVLLPRRDSLIEGWTFAHPLIALAADGSMLQDVMGVPGVLSVTWTLTYEMVFYCLITALFTMGRHRSSAQVAVGFAAVALLLGGVIPASALSVDQQSIRSVALAGGLVMVLAIGAMLSGIRSVTRTAAVLLAGVALTLTVVNGRASAFEGLIILATMFCGTVIYRAEHGQIDRPLAVFCCGFTIAAGFLAGYLYDYGPALHRTWSGSWMAFSFAYLAAWAVFLGGMLLRKRRFPRLLSRLGAISYSVYLLHIPLILTMDRLLAGHPPFRSWQGRLAQFTGFMAALLIVSYLSYRLVEQPFQKLGRRLLPKARPEDPVAADEAGVPELALAEGR